jgi:radical SAM superfamily enzyme YgiQ (UPF0313 family)
VNKKRLYLVHAQGRYGENTYIPLSVGCLWAYARTFPEITAAYEMVDFLYLKEPIERAVARLEAPDVVGLAHYIWNAEWNKAFARAVKERWPSCTIIVGGVQVPDESPRILEENPQFDFAIYGEGEGAFADFLREHIKHTGWVRTGNDGFGYERVVNYTSIGSLIWRSQFDGIVINPRHAFVPLEELRSPYLDGVFDSLWSREPRWQVLQEFDRGCPYLCSMCAWGQAALNDIRLFPEERIRAEIEWFGQHGVDYLDQADANYGIVKRDVELTKFLVETKRKYGYPKTFRTSFAKNSNETIYNIATMLHEANMLKSVTLAMQSMESDVLVNIKRKNIKFDKFGDLIKRYEDAGIPTYTELILGLAGESFDTFLNGIERCLEAGQHRGLFCYLNISLPNTEQADPKYVEAHGLKTRSMLAMLTHGTPNDSVPREKQDIVVATTAMPHDDWKKAWLISKTIEIFHAQGGLLRDVAIMLHNEHQLRYVDFYMALLYWCLQNPHTVAGQEIYNLRNLLDNVLDGDLWDCIDPRLGDISWPPEEFAYAHILLEADKFYSEVENFLLKWSIPDHMRALSGPLLGEDTVTWARDHVWYGRKGTGKRRAT